MLKGQAVLPEGMDQDEHGSGVQRAVQGVPADEVVAAYRAAMGVLRDAFLDLAVLTDVPASTVLDGTRRLWGPEASTGHAQIGVVQVDKAEPARIYANRT
jgi:putative transposase